MVDGELRRWQRTFDLVLAGYVLTSCRRSGWRTRHARSGPARTTRWWRSSLERRPATGAFLRFGPRRRGRRVHRRSLPARRSVPARRAGLVSLRRPTAAERGASRGQGRGARLRGREVLLRRADPATAAACGRPDHPAAADPIRPRPTRALRAGRGGRTTVSKRDRDGYRRARKASWGDTFDRAAPTAD